MAPIQGQAFTYFGYEIQYGSALEHFSAKWIRFAVKKCGTTKKRADSMQMESALAYGRSHCMPAEPLHASISHQFDS
ncbi:hypothetical protein CHELA20_40391 [Hyphomicrobiales bacterium]|nr:hypothetical protein CHELA20_40391 [Hyphomicrobiales bacterium]CAH1688476.1 hypothetical protein CHELA41_40248 [Hyphomicrobiales bacterium]